MLSFLQVWVDSLPDHLRFSEENLDHQTAMFETPSNSAAWCYCFMHVLYPLCYLSLLEVRRHTLSAFLISAADAQ